MKRRLWHLILTILVLAAFFPLALIEAGENDVEVVDLAAPEVKELVEKDGAALINVLSEIEFENQHIPGSINIPIIHLKNSDKLPPERNKPVIFHCMGKR